MSTIVARFDMSEGVLQTDGKRFTFRMAPNFHDGMKRYRMDVFDLAVGVSFSSCGDGWIYITDISTQEIKKYMQQGNKTAMEVELGDWTARMEKENLTGTRKTFYMRNSAGVFRYTMTKGKIKYVHWWDDAGVMPSMAFANIRKRPKAFWVDGELVKGDAPEIPELPSINSFVTKYGFEHAGWLLRSATTKNSELTLILADENLTRGSIRLPDGKSAHFKQLDVECGRNVYEVEYSHGAKIATVKFGTERDGWTEIVLHNGIRYRYAMSGDGRTSIEQTVEGRTVRVVGKPKSIHRQVFVKEDMGFWGYRIKNRVVVSAEFHATALPDVPFPTVRRMAEVSYEGTTGKILSWRDGWENKKISYIEPPEPELTFDPEFLWNVSDVIRNAKILSGMGGLLTTFSTKPPTTSRF